MEFENLIGRISAGIGVELNVVDGVCGVNVDGVPVILRHVEEFGVVLMDADLGAPPPQNEALLYKALLESNHAFRSTAGATFSLNPSDGHVFLEYYVALELLDDEFAVKRFATFADTVVMWREFLSSYRPSEAVPDACNLLNLLRV